MLGREVAELEKRLPGAGQSSMLDLPAVNENGVVITDADRTANPGKYFSISSKLQENIWLTSISVLVGRGKIIGEEDDDKDDKDDKKSDPWTHVRSAGSYLLPCS